MSPTLQPASSPYADLYVWKSQATIDPGSGATPVVQAPISDQVQFLADSFFCLMAFAGSSNYDAYFPNYPIGGAAAIGGARIPNNFAVLVTQNNDQKLSSLAIPQACICGSGYTQGNQLPFPMLWPPMTTINFDYTMIAPFTLFSDDEETTQIPLDIDFGLYGYNVPRENLESFLAAWPEMQRVARARAPQWLQSFTSMAIPGLTA